MLKKSKKKLILSIVVFVFILSIFVFNATFVKAKIGGYKPVCPKDCSPAPEAESEENRYIRLQMSIPGVTETCSYETKIIKNGKLEPDTKECHYIKANLPLFIKKVYNFSMGVIAIIAVITIMIAGMQWMTAAGDPGKIKSAQRKMGQAVLGVVLILMSYVILNLINPDLVKLSLTDMDPVNEIQQPQSKWCDELPEQIVKGKVTVIQNASGETYSLDKQRNNLNWLVKDIGMKCGVKYSFGYEATNGKFIEMGQCDGRGNCTGDSVCAQVGTARYCMNSKDFCERYNKRKCHEADAIIKDAGKTGEGCSFEKRENFLGIDALKADSCVYGSILYCGKNKNDQQINCQEISKYVKKGKDSYDDICIDSTDVLRAIADKHFIVCKEEGDSFYLASKLGKNKLKSRWNICEGECVCPTEMICSDYKNEANCITDPCNAGQEKGCKWEDNKCKSNKPEE